MMAAIMQLCPGPRAAALGLWQFKQTSAPRWERLYMISPTWAGLALAGWDIRRAVVHPGPLSAGPGLASSGDDLPLWMVKAENEIASRPTAWQSKRQR